VTDRYREPGGIAITWAGHSTALIELDGVRLLTDPVVHDRVGPLRRLAPRVEGPVFEHVDVVLLSHLHADHSHLRSLRTVGSAVRILAPRGSALWLRRHGFHDVVELRAGEEASVGDVRVHAVEALHNPHRWHFRHRRLWPLAVSAQPIGYVVRGSASCYFAGDTDLFEGMSALAGSIDVALLPIWGWGDTVGHGHLDPERAARAVAMIVPRAVVPIHWGTFVLARPARRPADLARPPRRFAELVAQRAPRVQVRVLAPGERMELDRDERSAEGRSEGAS
jgi:L-ascorbate metabolism protein UlaG (beta-lactamase superfamily)